MIVWRSVLSSAVSITWPSTTRVTLSQCANSSVSTSINAKPPRRSFMPRNPVIGTILKTITRDKMTEYVEYAYDRGWWPAYHSQYFG